MISNSTRRTKINYADPVLLWEQPTTTTTYSGGVINFSGSYSMYIVEFKAINSSNNHIKMLVPLSNSEFYTGGSWNVNSGLYAFYVRRFNYVRSNSISIGSGFYVRSFSSSDNTLFIPLKIWGIAN